MPILDPRTFLLVLSAACTVVTTSCTYFSSHTEALSLLNNRAWEALLKKDYATAQQLFTQAAQEAKLAGDKYHAATSLRALANVYLAQDKLPEAETTLRESINCMNDIQQNLASHASKLELCEEHLRTLLALGDVLSTQGKFGAAEPVYKEAIHLNDDSLEPLPIGRKYLVEKYCICLKQLGREKEAFGLEVTNLASGDLGSLEHLVRSTRHSYRAGDWEQADQQLEALRLAARRFSTCRSAKPAEALLCVSERDLSLNRIEQAESELKEAMKMGGISEHTQVMATAGLALCYERQGKTRLSEQAWSKAKASSPRAAAKFLLQEAELLARMGSYPQAFPLFEKALLVYEQSHLPPRPELKLYSMFLKMAGNHKQASTVNARIAALGDSRSKPQSSK